MFIKKFIIAAFLLFEILIHLYKRIKIYEWKSYFNILDCFLLTYPLYLLVAKYLNAKAKR